MFNVFSTGYRLAVGHIDTFIAKLDVNLFFYLNSWIFLASLNLPPGL